MLITDNFFSSNSKFLLIAGPCALESESQLKSFFEKASDISALRAGLFKMRTNPESFQGLGKEGVEIIKKLKESHPFEFVTEITDPRQIETVDSIVDVYQVGSRNMYNYELLRELNQLGKPVLFKRAFSATVNEWLSACGYMGFELSYWIFDRFKKAS